MTKGSKEKPYEELREQKKIILMSKDNIKLKHKYKMVELEYIRETDKIRHQQDLETIRIKSAEIKKQQERIKHG